MERAILTSTADASIIRSGDAVNEISRLQGMFDAHLVRPNAGREHIYEALFNRKAVIQNLNDVTGKKYTKAQLRELHELSIEMGLLSHVVWAQQFPNTVCTAGKNLALDTFLAGSSYSVTGPFMGLLSSSSYSATAAADTMASHAGWLEAGGSNAPTYTGNRKTAAWSAAASGAKALSAALSFAITGTGTVKGCFLVYGTGAVATKADTNGTLMSAGVFTGGDKVVDNLDTLNVSYSLAF